MESIVALKSLYDWKKEDEENLKELYNKAKESIDHIIFLVSQHLKRHDVVMDPKMAEAHRELLVEFLVRLLKADYDEEYLELLRSLGVFHVNMGLNPQYVDSFVSVVREAIIRVVYPTLNEGEKLNFITSLNKAIDMAKGMLSIAYREEELRAYIPSGRIHRLVVEKVRFISWLYDYFIVGVLAFAGLFVIFWILYEFYLITTGALALERGALGILGSVLILYAISELLTEEIKHIKGSMLSLKVFISVALAAVIRKVLILSLSPERVNELITLAFVLVALALSFWLVHKVEQSGKMG